MKDKKNITSCTDQVTPLVGTLSRKLLHIPGTIPPEENHVPDKGVEETMQQLPDTLSESLIGAVLVRQTLLADKEARVDLLREQDFLRV